MPASHIEIEELSNNKWIGKIIVRNKGGEFRPVIGFAAAIEATVRVYNKATGCNLVVTITDGNSPPQTKDASAQPKAKPRAPVQREAAEA